MFETILIANRGEIACRVIRTAKRLGIRTVAVFSDADKDALFVRMADVAVPVGAPPPRESYLRADRILEAAKRSGAQAIHPGYGFLSENAEFAERCAESGITFIGPTPSAIRAMGLKDAAKALMEKAEVPVVPGYHGEDQALSTLKHAAERIGFPVLIKAVAGGGGKGMRRVDRQSDFEAALSSAQREAENAFGDSRVLVEKYLIKPRHIEVQVFADAHGHAVHLFERDCSLQRRHQKVLEEAPAPGMPESMRKAMGEAAVRAALAIGYEGAGTVEFIADVQHGLREDAFYFMEMNTRLQVEHPVTEMITGLDLVELQLRVAAGQRLPFTQAEVPLRGHAIEARVYAEDPARDYLPQTGTLLRLATPEPGSHVRVDTGVVEGDTVSVFYDPMIAKLIVWDEDRASALRRLRRALETFEVAGLTTNLALLSAVARHPAFADGDVHTGFLAQHEATLFEHDAALERRLYALACVGMLERRRQRARSVASEDRFSPWSRTDGFRLNEDGVDKLAARVGEREIVIDMRLGRRETRLALPMGEAVCTEPRLEGDRVSCLVDGVRVSATYVEHGDRLFVLAEGRALELDRHREAVGIDEDAVGGGLVKAPMPGKIIAVLVDQGSRVDRGQPLLRLEAMKMEHTLSASMAGEVVELSAREGEQVEEGSILLSIKGSQEE
jgi:3-methylcrotonyl-CoA carboxylase alpha subunit